MAQPNFLSELSGKLGGNAGTSAGFSQSAMNSGGGRANAASARLSRGHTGNSAQGSDPSLSQWSGLEYYYMTTDDDQIGPASLQELKSKWKEKKVNGECFYWYEGMSGWEALSTNPSLLKQINPPPPPKKRVSLTADQIPPPPPRAQPPPPKSQPPPPDRLSTTRESLGNFAPPGQREKPQQQQQQAKRPVKKIQKGWIEKVTADLVPYYFNTATGALQWEKPEELSGGNNAATSGWVWLPDEEEGYMAAKPMGGKSYQLKDGRNTTYALPRGANPLAQLNIAVLSMLHSDLVLLDDLNEGLVLHNLRERYLKDEIYTGIGSILIAINPFKRLPLYSPEAVTRYNKRGNKVLPPHPFDVADSCYKTILEIQTNQSILVSGESGAGKTETTKQCLMFLAEVAGSESNIEQRVLSVNPILESFGNAKTLRNDNSSRFGRFSEIILSNDMKIAGAQIRSYLLEKSRVGYQQQGERNYHIFYQLCKSDWAQHYSLGGPGHYCYLANSGCVDVPGMDDRVEFNDVIQSMDSLGFTDAEKHSVFCIIAGIIQLGNVTFTSASINGADASTIDDAETANLVASQFGVDANQLHHALTHRTLEIIGQAPIKVPLRVEQAIENRDALAKYVYEKLFLWLVDRINKSLAPQCATHNFIGILDIFGFEIFKVNSFEQLCINFCNEKLQQLFNEDTFKNEENVYRNEGIEFPPIVFIDNQPVVDLIEMRGGIFTLLDDTVKGPGKPEQKDQKFGTLLDTKFASNGIFVPSNKHRGINYTAFSINHYAGQVTYSVDKFVEKNKDNLYPDLYDMMSASTDQFIKSQFAAAQAAKKTLANEFKSQLNSLMKELRGTESHFIRCIKANSLKKPRIFEGASCLEQLRCAGVFEAVSIRKNGFPFRYTFSRFVERYKCILATESGWQALKSNDPRDQCYEILSATNQPFSEMQWGNTMVMFRSSEYRILELCRALSTDRVSSKIQAKARGRLTRRYVALVKATRPKLRQALASRELGALESALQYVNQQLGAFAVFSISVPIAEWAQCKEMVVIIRESARLEPELEYWVYSDLAVDANFEMLFKFIKEARAIAHKRPTPKFDELYAMGVEQFEGWRSYRLNEKLEEVMKSIEKDEMEDIYAECKRLEYEDPRLEEIEKLVGLSGEGLLKMQYKRAHETGQAQRAIEKEIELKELCLEQFRDNFVFEKCSLLRDPIDYANSKFFSMHREEKAEKMLVHSKDGLITSLTRLEDPNSIKEAKSCFKCILGYCGDVRTTYPDTLAVSVLEFGLNGDAWLKAEIYAQLMKQLSENPNDDYSKGKVWKLLMLCLLHFSPGDSMENFVQIFIRDYCPERQKDTMIRQCHVIAYEEDAKAPPPVNMMESMLRTAGVDTIM